MKKKRLVLLGIIAGVIATGRWACDTTIRDQRLIDYLVSSATSCFPDGERPALLRVHAAQTRTGRMGGRQEHLYAEFTRPNDLEKFIRGVTEKLGEPDPSLPSDRTWRIERNVQRSGWRPTPEAPPWWPAGAGRADVVLHIRTGLTVEAPAGSDRIFVFYFVP